MTIIRNQSEADYNAMEGLRSSIIGVIDRKTLAHAKAKMTDWGNSDSGALKMGTACHDYLLRPETFAQKYTILDQEGPKTTKKEGCLTWYDAQTIYAIERSFKASPIISKLFSGITDTELSLTWNEGGIECKARIDAVSQVVEGNKSHVIIFDVKTSRSASQRDFEKSLVNYGYILQSAHYLAGAKANKIISAKNNNFLHVVVETEAPFLTAVYCIDDATLEIGEKRRQEAMRKFAAAQANDIWPGYSEQIETIAAPHWFFQDNGDLADGI